MEYVWTNENCLRLIEEYEKQPLLWNVEHQNYYDKFKRNVAWSTMAKNLNSEVDEIRYKMNNLHSGFRREKYKTKTCYKDEWGNVVQFNVPYQNGTRCKVYTSKWFAFKPMKFLLKDSDTAIFEYNYDNKSPSPSVQEDSMNQNSDSETSEQNGARNIKAEPAEKRRSRPPAVMRERLTRTKLQKRRLHTQSATPTERRTEDGRIIEALRALHKPEKKRDECDIFGEYIANALRKHDQRTRAMIKHAMNNILFESEMKKYNCNNFQNAEINLTEETNPLILPDQVNTEPMEESIIEHHVGSDIMRSGKLETIDAGYDN